MACSLPPNNIFGFWTGNVAHHQADVEVESKHCNNNENSQLFLVGYSEGSNLNISRRTIGGKLMNGGTVVGGSMVV